MQAHHVFLGLNPIVHVEDRHLVTFLERMLGWVAMDAFDEVLLVFHFLPLPLGFYLLHDVLGLGVAGVYIEDGLPRDGNS